MISFGKQAALIILRKALKEIASGKPDPLTPEQRLQLEESLRRAA